MFYRRGRALQLCVFGVWSDKMGKNFLFIGNAAPILAFLSYLLPIKIRYLGNLSERQMRFMESSGKKTVLYAYGVR